MTCLKGKLLTRQTASLLSDLETLQEDLIRLSRYIGQLADLTEEELAAYELSDQLQAIHQCIRHFETHCLTRQITAIQDEYVDSPAGEPDEPPSQPDTHWTPIRREARRATRLAGQLTGTLRKIRSGLGEYQDQRAIPKDILQINQLVGNAMNGLASDWFTNPE